MWSCLIYLKMPDGRRETGNQGEALAAEYLLQHGFSVLQRNFRTREGEIDIIAQKGDVLVFVEVKTLPNGTQELLSRVLDGRKQRRIVKTAQRFLAIHRQ